MADFNFYLNRQGVRGNKGEQGEQGFSPYISVNTNTANEYTLDVTNESGTFTTPNLRGNAIEDEGGTYIRYNPETQGMYTGYADTASTTQQGEVTLSTPENLAAGGDGTVTTSGDVFDFVENKISAASVNYVDIDDYTQKMGELDSEISDLDDNKLDFTDLSNTLVNGTNITITPNTQTGKITISGEPVDQAQADWNEADSTKPSYIKNKPTIPAAQIQSDWEQADSSALDYIKNKPVIDDELSSTSTNAVQNRLVTNAINLISNNMENLANKDLSNLTSAGDSRLHALKSYEDVGEVLTDAEGLADVTKYAHSNFDSSKFTTIGSLSIIDGVASGFVSQTNYLTASFTATSPTTSIEMWCKFIANNSDTNGCVLCALLGNLRLQRTNATTVGVRGFGSGGLSIDATGLIINNNDEVITHATITTTGAELDVWVNGVKTSATPVSRVNTFEASYSDLKIGGQYTNGNYSPASSIDLKYQKVLLDGVEVFNGCKTGIDTIKSDDYTVVGSPTITTDGVASGFNEGNYIVSNGTINFNLANNWKIINKFKVTSFDHVQFFGGVGNSNNFGFGLNINTNGRLDVYISSNGSSWDVASVSSTKTINVNTDYYMRRAFNGTAYTVDISTDGINWTNYISASTTTKVYSGATSVCVGFYAGLSSVNRGFLGSIDLNAFKIYVNGDLVYQPCLKIPYTLSKTGSKVVNSAYRDRVNDMYNQFGNAPYYTLSDTDFTLPQGELYGMIENAATAIPSGVVQSPSITNIVSLTQAEYDLIVPESDILYIITPSS